MMNLLKQIVAIIMLGCLIVALLYIGVAIVLVALGVGAVAAIWFAIRFYFIRRDIKTVLHEYHTTTSYADALRQRQPDAEPQGEIIEVEYTEVPDKKNQH